MALKLGSASIRIIIILTIAHCGCTNVNRQLGNLALAPERRPRNHTNAALAAHVIEPTAQGPAAVAVKSDAGAPHPPRDVRDDGVFVGIAVSGGGSRSANFSAACFLQLERLGLLQRTDYISSVSGGSMTAAYYCAQSDDLWNPANVQRKLSHAFATDLWIQTMLPWNTLTLMFTDYDRSDLLAAQFENVLFRRSEASGSRAGGMTFADLRADRPRLLINATDLQTGRKFIFCNEMFDELNSDLSSFPLGHAVAASSAVPVVMHQVTLRDYSTVWPQYRHLIDGGIVDNLGVQSLVETYTAHIKSAKDANEPDPYPGGAVLIVVDARTQFDAKLSDKGDIGLVESMIAGTGLTSTALLNRASSATLAEIIVRYSADEIPAQGLRDSIDKLEKTGTLTIKGKSGKPVQVIHLALSRLDEVSDLPFRSFRESINNISTYFNIDPAEAFSLYQAADLLMKAKFEPDIRKIVDELDHPAAAPAATKPAS